ncbi:hypothetical protein [Hymenobacter pini]|uniref:hypothetical protein n=1 Tax=Hymenobacter pini TaxID=2880879 RepID=UPI001CF23A92|nr:hypothetical protein [Hymenobacter pini]MCA8830657.1 hypothetical protein [Hymenobacter pini]
MAVAPALAQRAALDRQQRDILQEGLALYESERASWVATDVLQARHEDLSQLGGYLSYTEGDSVRTIFFRRPGTEPVAVLYTFQFARTSIEPTTVRASGGRPFTAREQHLLTMRQAVYAELYSGKVLGTAYRFPAKTNPNVVVLDQGEPRAYVITGPKEGRLLPIGNDFRFILSKTGEVRQVERLHNSYLALEMPAGSEQIQAGMHSHLEQHPFITATDICSLLLYKAIFPASQHYVMSKDYVSLFDVPKQQLVILTRKAFDKIGKAQTPPSNASE